MRLSLLFRFALLLLVLFTLSIFQLPVAQAVTRSVNNSTDSNVGSLRWHIANAAPGDTISIGLAGPITLTSGEITIDKDLVIEATRQDFIIRSNNTSRIFYVNPGVTVEIRNLTISSSRATDGGAISNFGTLTVNSVIFSTNSATTSAATGGALSNNGTLSVINSTFSGNTSNGSGGAIYSNGTTTVTGSTFINNSVLGSEGTGGGAIYAPSGTLNVSNSTFVTNKANSVSGGAIYAVNSTTVDSSTFLSNTALNGANVFVGSGITTIGRTIMSSGSCVAQGGTLNDGNDNIAFNTTGCPGTNVDPLLGTLTSNGGLTQTVPLQIGSPAIDVYTTGCLANDQRGITRPQGTACDIGAYEAVPNTITVTNLNDSGAGSLRDAIAAAPPNYTINFGVSGTITLTTGQIIIDKNLVIDGNGQSITLSGNNASRIFQINAGVTVEIKNLVRIQNGRNTTGSGGSIVNGGTLTLNNLVISGSAWSGGAIFNGNGSTLIVNNSTLSNSSATNGNGGAIASEGAIVTINNSTISSNNSQNSGDGGAIRQLAGTLTITNSIFESNRALNHGGAISAGSGVINVTNTTFYNNTASLSGNDLYCYNSCNMTLDSNTIVHDTAPSSTLIDQLNSTVTLRHTIISRGSCNAAVADGGSNIAFNAPGCPGLNVNPLLTNLRRHGGTTDTFALIPGSPAIDAYVTNCAATDQRGITRAQGAACDIGAYEVYRGTITVTNLNDSGAGSLRAAVADAQPDTTINFSVSGTITLNSTIASTKNLTIDGTGQNITLSGNTTTAMFYTNGSYYLHVRNLTFIDGLGNFGGVAGIAPTITGYYVVIDNSTFSNNVITGSGGAVLSANGYLNVSNSTFSNNTATGTNSSGISSGSLGFVNNSTFSNNSSGTGNGGAIVNFGNMTITNSTFSGNSAVNGGAIAETGGILTIINSTFSGNSATGSGGAIYVNFLVGTTATVIDSSTFSNNTAPTGANINHPTSTITLSRSILNNGSCNGTITDGGNNIAFNSAGCLGINVDPLLGTLGNNGGATQTIPLLTGSPAIDAYSTSCPATDQRGITRPQGSACDIGAYEVQPPASLIVTNLNDSGVGSLRGTINSALPGDTIVFGVSGTVTLTTGQILIDKNLVIDGSGQNITINGNNDRGVVQVNAGVTAELHNLSITGGNDGPNLGGGVSNFGTLTIANVMIFGNVANGGGGVFNSGNLTIMNSTITGNTIFPFIGSGEGGGILNGSGGTMTINNSTIANNTNNTGNGGGVANGNGSTLIITNSTIANNSASGNGGAVYNGNGTMFTISSATVSGNTAGGSGSGLYNNTVGSLNSSATIYHNNTCTGTITDGGNNIAFNASGCPGTNVNPLLGTLGNNGGITQTIPLLVGSPAIDAYSIGCLATDQRGTTRPQGTACDIGAYEYVEVPPTPTPTTTSITENEFYAAVEAASASYPDITNIIIDFVPNMLNLTVATQEGVVGNVSIAVTQEQDFAAFSITSITVNGGTPPDSYITIINRDLPAILTSALDALVIERFGDLVDVQSITVSNSTLTLSLD